MAQRRAFLPGGNALSRPRLSARRLDRSGDRSEVLYHSLKPVYSKSFSEGVKEPEQMRLRRFAGTSIEKSLANRPLPIYSEVPLQSHHSILQQHMAGMKNTHPKKLLGKFAGCGILRAAAFPPNILSVPSWLSSGFLHLAKLSRALFAVGISGQTRPGTDSAVSFGDIPAFLSKNATNSLLRGYYK